MKLVTSVPSKPARTARSRRLGVLADACRGSASFVITSRGGRKCGSVCGTTEGWMQ